MPSIVFAAPILTGKTDAWKRIIAELSGSRKSEYIQSRKNLGITREVACLQQTPQGDMAVVYIEARDTSHIVQDMMQATGPFDKWFAQAVLHDLHGMDSSHLPPANEVLLDLL